MTVVSRIQAEVGAHWIDGHLVYREGGLQRAYRACYPTGRRKAWKDPRVRWEAAVETYGLLSLDKRPNTEAFLLYLSSEEPLDRTSNAYAALSTVLGRPLQPPGYEWLYDEICADQKRLRYRGIIVIGEGSEQTSKAYPTRLRRDLESWGLKVKAPRGYLDYERWMRRVGGVLEELLAVYRGTPASRHDELRHTISKSGITVN